MRIFLILLFLLNYLQGHCQNSLKRPIALIEAGGQRGAGFLVGQNEQSLYIISAFHVIEYNPESIQLTLIGNKEEEFKLSATVEKSDEALDLVVLTCKKPSNYFTSPSFPLAYPELFSGLEVTVLGHPDGVNWDINRGARVKIPSVNSILGEFTISSQGIRPGSSGGAVLNKNDELIGMVLEFNKVNTTCINAETIVKKIDEWGVPKNLFYNNIEIEDNYLSERAGEMIFVPGGTFKMGSLKSSYKDDKPVHEVKISPFYISKYEVTVEKFKKFVSERKGGYRTEAEQKGYSLVWNGQGWDKSPKLTWEKDQYGAVRSDYNYPVVHISWNDAQAFVEWLSKTEGAVYRLPTEAEWEYAARGGSEGAMEDYSGSKNVKSVAWFDNNSAGKIHSIGRKRANNLGIHDMSGNVAEWCQDWYSRAYYKAFGTSDIVQDPSGPQNPDNNGARIIRGGSWTNDKKLCTVSARNFVAPTFSRNNLGFRVVREL